MATARTMRDAFDARFAPLGLNLTQASMIAYLHQFGPVTQTKCADHLRLGRAAIGVTIDRLQERGYIDRQADIDDRRVWRVSLSPDGVELAQRITAIDEVLRGELREGISRPERQALASLLTRLQANLIRATAASPVAEQATPSSPPRATTPRPTTTETP